jgi:hypothetical protein
MVETSASVSSTNKDLDAKAHNIRWKKPYWIFKGALVFPTNKENF